MLDLEKGRGRTSAISTNHGASSASPLSAFPQRRRRTYILLLLMALIIYMVYSIDGSKQHSLSSGSWKWVKDSMRPVEHKLNSDSTVESRPIASMTKIVQEDANAALNEIESRLDVPMATPLSSIVDKASEEAPSSTDQILVFLDVMKTKDYRIPESQMNSRKELMPATKKDLQQSITKLLPEGKTDAELYTSDYSSWLSKHRSASPLTVFSKSYCPYSARAKELLKSMGAKFDVYEVDLREDASALQHILKDLSGHTTFPTIFVGDKLIGGSDDLSRLQTLGVLKGVLEGASVKLT